MSSRQVIPASSLVQVNAPPWADEPYSSTGDSGLATVSEMHTQRGGWFIAMTMARGTPIEQSAGFGGAKSTSLMSQRTSPSPIKQAMFLVGDCHWYSSCAAPAEVAGVAGGVGGCGVGVGVGVTTTVTVDDGGRVTVDGGGGELGSVELGSVVGIGSSVEVGAIDGDTGTEAGDETGARVVAAVASG